MRTRNKSYSHYGITDQEKDQILTFCREAGEEDREVIFWALKELPPYIVPYIFMSLVDGKSYEKLDAQYGIVMSKEDFYGYRRNGLEAIKRYLLMCGKL